MSENTKNPNIKPIKVNIPEHLRAALSSNIVNITTASNGLVMLDFIFVHPNDKDNAGNQLGTLVSRIVLPVQVAQELKMILSAHLGKIKSE